MVYHEFTILYQIGGSTCGRHLILRTNSTKQVDKWTANMIRLGWPFILYLKKWNWTHHEIISTYLP